LRLERQALSRQLVEERLQQGPGYWRSQYSWRLAQLTDALEPAAPPPSWRGRRAVVHQCQAAPAPGRTPSGGYRPRGLRRHKGDTPSPTAAGEAAGSRYLNPVPARREHSGHSHAVPSHSSRARNGSDAALERFRPEALETPLSVGAAQNDRCNWWERGFALGRKVRSHPWVGQESAGTSRTRPG